MSGTVLRCLLYVNSPTILASYAGDIPRNHFVTAEDKIRELCAQVLAAQDDETANRILPELRDALHAHCERLRLKVAAEYPFHKDSMAAD